MNCTLLLPQLKAPPTLVGAPTNDVKLLLLQEKYIIIDNEIKIWYGDLILHNLIKNKGIISFNRIDIELSKTVKNTTNLTNILTKDKHVYETKYKN